MNNYTRKDLRRDFGSEEDCLRWLASYLYPDGICCRKCNKVTSHYLIKGRKVFSCSRCGTQRSMTKGTPFYNSRVSLVDWFTVIWLMSSDKAGTSSMQITRELGVSYPTALRMTHTVRRMMAAPEGLFTGEIEVDESYAHPNVYKRSSAQRQYGRTGSRTGQVVFGILERDSGAVKVWHVKTAGARVLKPLIQNNVREGSLIHSDGFRFYTSLPKLGYHHRSTDHGAFEFFTPDSSTQRLEGFWSTWKPRMRGTFRHITSKYLQLYLNEYSWRYSHRKDSSMF